MSPRAAGSAPAGPAPPARRRARPACPFPSCSEPRALKLDLAAGRGGLDHRIHAARVQRPGLALTGYTDYIRYGRVQIIGSSETGYLRKLGPRRREGDPRQALPLPDHVLRGDEGHRAADGAARGGRGPRASRSSRRRSSRPRSSSCSPRSSRSGSPRRLHLHSVLLDVFGLGVLILGESGIGKSECALDLIDRGHRLVADDVVEVKRMGDVLVGASPDLTRYHMELRGLGDPQHQGPLRRVLDPALQAGRARRAARALGGGEGVRPPRPARRDVPHPRRRGAARRGCRWPPGGTSRSSSRWRPATSSCARAATTRRSASSSGSTRWWATRPAPRRRRPRVRARKR